MQVATVPAVVLWRPNKSFDPAIVVIEAFLPVFALFAVVFFGCLVAGLVTVLIEMAVPGSSFFEAEPGSKRSQELRGFKPIGQGFTFSMNSTLMHYCIISISASALPLIIIRIDHH